MTPFLQLVAEDLKRRVGKDLNRTVIIFPNKRASLFLNTYFAPTDATPVWMPKYMSIRELFTSLTVGVVADPIETVCRLYRHYIRLTGSEETLDYFYGWGERLLADFDDIDKNMADPELLFRDLRDYAEMGQSYEVLTPEQIAQLQTFSRDFATEKLTKMRENFSRLWKVLLPLYRDLRAELAAEGLAYEGQLYRDVVEGLKNGTVQLPPHIDHVAFVGFNVIDRVEGTLFEILQDAGKALFYWDYDLSYAREKGDCKAEAGIFLQENLCRFPNALSEVEGHFDNFLRDRTQRELEYVSAPTDMAQAQSITDWLADPKHFNPQIGHRTAVVLCDENLLQPVLHSLPPTITQANITKGFPLSHTPAFACVTREIGNIEAELDREAALNYVRRQQTTAKAKGYTERQANALEKATEPYAMPKGDACLPFVERLLKSVEAEAVTITAKVSDNLILSNLYTEAYFKIVTTINRFLALLEDNLLQVSLPTLLRLLTQVLRSLSIPFHGEPAEGLQIMGVLETRCLDFDHIIMLSVGEGILPQKSSEASFIPALLRREYGLTTPERKVAVYAYYFHRLLQRATNVRLTYNDSTESSQKGDMSRFMKALLVEEGARLHVRHCRIENRPKLYPRSPQAAQPESSFSLAKAQMSPSALKVYGKCPRAFYFKYVKHYKTPQAKDDIINANEFGSIFHKAAENLYLREFDGKNRPITPARIERFLQDGGAVKLRRLVLEAFKEAGIEPSEITVNAIIKYLHQLLCHDSGKDSPTGAPALEFQIESAEKEYEVFVPLRVNGSTINFRLYGSIDRLDEATLPDGSRCFRVIDYKTGKKQKDRDQKLTLDRLFQDSKNYPDNALQTFIYSLMVIDRPKAVIPELYYIPSMSSKDYTSMLDYEGELVTDFRPFAEKFRKRLIERLEEIVDPANPFTPTEAKEHCKYCDFRLLCGRS